MVSEIRIYAEGGGEGKDSKAAMRRGFSEFLFPLRERARSRRIRWRVVACGSRNNAFNDFKIALKTHPGAFNALLVDSEGAIQTQTAPWVHLQQRDGWVNPGTTDEHCHLMVQTMEAWLIADVNTLASFYGPGFNANPIPGNPDVEAIEKSRLVPILRQATRNTTKGEYHKTRHAPQLLGSLDAERVRRRAGYCRRLFVTVEHLME